LRIQVEFLSRHTVIFLHFLVSKSYRLHLIPTKNYFFFILTILYEKLSATLNDQNKTPYFATFRSTPFETTDQSISFDQMKESDKSGMNKETGVYIVPQEGKYKFEFTGQSTEFDTEVIMRLNGGERSLASSTYLVPRHDETFGAMISISAIVNLKVDNTVDVFLKEGEIQRGGTFSGQFLAPPSPNNTADAPELKRRSNKVRSG